MKLKLNIIIAIFTFLTLNPIAALGFENDDIEIYELFINHFFKINQVSYGFPDFDNILIYENTALSSSSIDGDEIKKYLPVFMPVITKEMLEHLILINKTPMKFKKEHFKIVKPEIITDRIRKEIFDKGDLEEKWNEFGERYGKFKGILKLSRISFTDNKRYALMNYGFSCGSKCGGGGLVLLSKELNKWSIIVVFPLWVS